MDSDSQAVTISVPNQINTLAAAIDAATSNDVIQITNGITYHEDLIIPQAKSGITLEGVGAPPTIRPLHTANNRSPLKVFMGLVGSPGAADCAGFIVEGNGTTLRNLVIADPTAGAEDPISPLGISQSLTVFGSDVTIEDCTIVSDSGSEEHAGLLAMGGDWPTLDTQFAMALLGTPFSTAGYTTPDPVNGLTITNCEFLSDGDGENSSAFVRVRPLRGEGSRPSLFSCVTPNVGAVEITDFRGCSQVEPIQENRSKAILARRLKP
jgi:hypothetical protein